MPKFSNINTFSKSSQNEEIPKELNTLGTFTMQSKKIRNILINSKVFNNIKRNPYNKNEYVFIDDDKEYIFSLFSDWNLQKFDKKVLESKNRFDYSLPRILKLINSLGINFPNLVIGSSNVYAFDLLIVYKDGIQTKVIDYAKNLIMDKEDYYELFCFKEINTVSLPELYFISDIYRRLGYHNLYEYLIFTKEIFNDLKRYKEFSYLKDKFSLNGTNYNNYYFLGDKSDFQFFQKEDTTGNKYEKITDEIDDFTIKLKSKHIKPDKEEGYYRYKKLFKQFSFRLISNLVVEEEAQKILLSMDRFKKCHHNSINFANALKEVGQKDVYVVFGKFKINEIDYVYHSWIEIKDLKLVLDWNHNLIIDLDKYYELYEIEVLNKTYIEDIIKYDTLIKDFDLYIDDFTINLFGNNIYNDLMKNTRILKK